MKRGARPETDIRQAAVTIDRWDSTSRYPEGHFVRALGQVESKEAEQESLLLEFEVPYRPFGIAILDCLPPEGEQWVVPPKGDFDLQNIWRDRNGLKDVIVCSVDPSTSPPPITQSRNVHSDSAPESESLQSPSSTPVTSAASVIPTKYPFNLIITTATILPALLLYFQQYRRSRRSPRPTAGILRSSGLHHLQASLSNK
ncbi:hypothetical protein GG344DRAFT_71441 [Lentinula edodes]|nr:hypothetical protein GG344DRAFT_71441 [Lentinula edodes]